MTRIPPGSVSYWTGEIEQKLRPINEQLIGDLLREACADNDKVRTIMGELRRLPFAMHEYQRLHDAGVGAGRAAEYARDLLAVLSSLNALLEDPAAGPVLSLAGQQSADAWPIVSDFRRLAPLMQVVLTSQLRRLPQAHKGGNHFPQRQYLALRLIDVFRRHQLPVKATRNSPATRVFAELLDAAGEGPARDNIGRPDVTLAKALRLIDASQQNGE